MGGSAGRDGILSPRPSFPLAEKVITYSCESPPLGGGSLARDARGGIACQWFRLPFLQPRRPPVSASAPPATRRRPGCGNRGSRAPSVVGAGAAVSIRDAVLSHSTKLWIVPVTPAGA